jgi:DNA-binding CsgD family transcriptional regulator
MAIDELERAGHWLTTLAARPRAAQDDPERRPGAPGIAGSDVTEPRSLRAVPFLGFESHEEARRAEQAFLSLSGREATVLAYLAYGFSAKEVAHTLSLSCRTVDTFRTRALLKLRARNTADAVRMLACLSALAGLAPVREAAE